MNNTITVITPSLVYAFHYYQYSLSYEQAVGRKAELIIIVAFVECPKLPEAIH